ncbi:Retinol dehydrogenase 11 [Papilio machaon]|uniref:Retinol dehydrogenase 11 n=1 Tax=Papilio machaon TaxID=76193 RepID=A0A0N0PAY2_PAPMA|nr:Retinol dehydrogenase 11 [Papilio machaon]
MFLLVTWAYSYSRLTLGICKSSRHLVGKVVIVTGGNAGIGYETAKDLADRGARVIIACRNEVRGISARDSIIKATGNNDVHYRNLDLASLKSVKKFADDFLKTENRLHILINNAGVFASDNVKTEDGLLLGTQVNHFGPFLLTSLLLPLLKSSAPSRIINVSSIAYAKCEMDLQNLNAEKENEKSYQKINLYGMSKLCNILMAVELSHRLKDTGVTANSLHPGLVRTDILYDINVFGFQLILPLVKLFTKSAWEGAQTSIYLAVSPEVDDISGKYFVDCRVKKTVKRNGYDLELAHKLWELSEKYVGLKVDHL